jgi:hypothetical protein
VNSKQLYSYLKQFGKDDERYIPREIKMLPPELLREFIMTYAKGDGCITKSNDVLIGTKSKRLADDLQEIFLKLGMNASIKIKRGSSYNPNGVYYEINGHYKTCFRVMTKPEKVKYRGFVYCATVPNGTLLVRRNFKVTWSGNSNNASIGDPIVQPGVYDGGNVLTDTIAKLKRFVPIQFEQGSTCPVAQGFCAVYNALAKVFGAKTRLVTVKEVYNTVDCAIASPVSPDVVSDEIIDIGVPEGTTVPSIGLKVRKSGRTSCLTHGEIDTVDLTVRVMYDYKTALFKDQIGIQPVEGKFSAGGDSGSAILAEDEPKIVGLLFAGDESGYTIANQIQNVMAELNVEV